MEKTNKRGVKMYKLFIVDDEPPARNGLRDYFNWSQYGIEVVGEGDDGESSFQEICEKKPDILITDVRMPNMDGMELSRKLRSILPGIKIVFISAYSEIEYMKSALEVDAVDYILKPINMDTLRTIIG
jgi:two-component system response regulator YesN